MLNSVRKIIQSFVIGGLKEFEAGMREGGMCDLGAGGLEAGMRESGKGLRKLPP